MFRQLALAAALGLAFSAAQAVTVTSVTATGTVFNAPSLVIDGDFALGTNWLDAPNVFWTNQTGSTGAVITLSFDQLYTLKDVSIGVDNNDFYVVQVSADTLTWNTLFVSLPTFLDPGFSYSGASMIKKSSISGDPAYSSLIDFPPVFAKQARIYAVGGDGAYSVSEVQFSGIAAIPEPGSYAMLVAGLLGMGAVMRRRVG